MTTQFTEWQQVLFDRLVTLGEWATNGDLPLRVLEIRGFGSFFRGKARPSDVDLVLRVQRPDRLPEFDRFIELLQSVRDEWELEDRFSTPREALINLRSVDDSRCIDASDEEYRKFLSWVEPFSWNMLRPATLHGQCSLETPEHYVVKLMKKRLPKLNVVQFQNPDDTDVRPGSLRCGFMVTIWSADRPDTAENLASILSEETIAENLHKELAYFRSELPHVEALMRLLEAEVSLLERTPRRRKRCGSSLTWFRDFAKGHRDLVEYQEQLAEARKASERFEKEEWGRLPKGKLYSSENVVQEVEALRETLKQRYQRIDLLKALRNRLADFKSGSAQTELPAKEYVVTDLLSRGNRKQKEAMSVFLRDLGYPVDRVLRRDKRPRS